uniref:G-patch domain-containing protein n=1 Tax=Meloidogyne floridensis TaxID=298350 RepID=A0A915NWJ5_9BILA
MDTSFNDSSNVFENDVQYFETFNSILKVIDEREAELSNSRLFSLWENVFKSENILDQKIKKSASYQELENVLKLEKESLAAVENELAKLKIQVDQQLNEYNLKRDEILGLVLNDNDKENNEISISERDIMEPVKSAGKNHQNMDEEEISERFDFDQTDYEFATGTRRFKRQTEEERIYGIWARDEDSDDDARPSFSSGKKRKEGPVRFVSVGVEKTSKESTVTETDEITIEARPEKRSKPSSFDQRTTNSVGSEVFAGFRNAAFQFASASGADAGWLKSGKGNVVMQMMQKMGYEQGKGLGKSKQGIVEPVQAVQRPGRGAVGAYGSEAKGPRFGETAAEAQNRINQSGSLNNLSEAETAQFPARGTWRKSNAGKVRIQYKTLNDVISEGENQRFGDSGFGAVNAVGKIIDMTGPEQRIYEDFNSFSRRARMTIIADVERTNFNVPELTHNLNTLLDVTEEEICKTDRQVRYLKDQNEVLLNEQSRIEDELTESKAEIVRLEEVYTIVKQFYQESSLENSTLEECRELFITLREKYSVEYTLYGLDAIAIPVLLPKISKYFATWDPLDPEHASYGFEMMEDWKEILGSTKGGSLFKHFDKDSSEDK